VGLSSLADFHSVKQLSPWLISSCQHDVKPARRTLEHVIALIRLCKLVVHLLPLFSKTCEVKPYQFSKLNVMGIHLPGVGPQYLGYLVWGRIISLLHVHLWLVSFGVWFPTASLLHLPFSMWPPFYLTVEGLFCQSLGHFQNELHRCSCYLGVSVGQGELSILLLSIFL